ncbi:NUDIX hydrolase [Prosthecomicrobium sp. N25]|uniref:NUDIX hydrolase n=1 Tax=Prosthecomicrobium sp. N25 TaxID=3129254 RepID=UPI00307820B7
MTSSQSTVAAMAAGRPVLGVSVSVWRGDEVLLVRRGREPSKGLWSPVGGKVEFGESLEAAARREVAEETGVDCEILGFSTLRELIMPDGAGGVRGHVVLAVFGARWLAGEARAGDDADAVAWVAADRLEDRPLVAGVVPYILGTRRLTGGAQP